MPKLLQLNITANWGSTGKIAESIGMAAMKQGWESFIAFGRWSNPSHTHLIKVGNKLDMYLHYGEQRIFDNEGLCSRGATKHFIKQIEEIRPDIVHLHNIHDHYLNYKYLFEYLNQTDIKVVWTFHDCWAITGHCFHFVTKGCDKWKTKCCDCPLNHIYPNTLLDRSSRNYELKKYLFCSNKNLTIVSCSYWIRELVENSFLKDKRIEVIHNGVDIKVFRPVENVKNRIDRVDGSFKIIAVSSVWNKDKGIDDIFELRKLLPADYSITIVGLSSKQMDSLPEGIIGIERTQNVQELVELYNSADVLINPTYADTFPTVNLEALACGTPVITYKTGGSPEAVRDGNESGKSNERIKCYSTGMVVEQGNVGALAEAIQEMKENPLSSEGCRERAVKYFDKNKCFSEYISLYDELLK